MRISVALVVGVLLVGLSCDSGGGDDPEPVSRAEVVRSLALDVATPTYGNWAEAAGELEAAAAELCPAPSSAELLRVQAAWRAARVDLKRAEAFSFGPWVEDRHGSAVDFWPIRTDAIEATVDARGGLDAASIASLGVASKGMPVLEYLWFDPQGGNDAVVTALADEHRCRFSAALATDVATNARALRSAWEPTGGGFASALADAGSGSALYLTVQTALDEIVNGTIFVLQDITDPKLGTPLGSKTEGVPDPEALESRFSDNARADIVSNLEGVHAVYLGPNDGLGLSALVRPENPELDAAIREQLDVATAAVAELSSPLRVMVVNESAVVEAARLQVRELRRLFEADVAALLGVTVTLNDNDGD